MRNLSAGGALAGQPLTAALYAGALQDITLRATGLRLRGLERSLSERRPYRLVIVGDSISEGADLSRYEDSYAYRLEQALGRILPYGVTVLNRSLGSRNMEKFMDPAYKALPAEPQDWQAGFARFWSTPGKSWYDHVRDTAPDDILLAHAMNSGDHYGKAAEVEGLIRRLYSDLDNWASRPGLALLSTFEPSLRRDTVAANPYIIRTNARMVRTLAEELGLIHADAHRLNRILRDGVDDVLTRTLTEFDWENLATDWQVSSGWTIGPGGGGSQATVPQGVREQWAYYKRSVRDFSMQGNISFRSAQENGWIVGRVVAGVDAQLVVMVTPNGHAIVGGGQGRVSLIHRPTGHVVAEGRVDLPVNSWGAFTWTAQGAHHVVTFQSHDGATGQPLAGASLALTGTHHGSQQDGWIGHGGDGSCDIPMFFNLRLYPMPVLGQQGDGTPAPPLATEAQLMGTWPIQWPKKDGNGMNHPNGAGQALMYSASLTGFLSAAGVHVALSRLASSATATPVERVQGDIELLGSWVSFDGPGGFPDPRVTRDGAGRVVVSGLIKASAAPGYPTAVARLPEGFRPSGTAFRQLMSSSQNRDITAPDGVDPMGIAFTEVSAGGVVTLNSGPPNADGWVDLSMVLEIA